MQIRKNNTITMKKIFITLAFVAIAISTSAQGKFTKPQLEPEKPVVTESEPAKEEANSSASVEKAEEKPVLEIDPKYASGAVPEVDGKVRWTFEYAAAGMSARQIYDKMLRGLMEFCKSEGQTSQSQVSVVNESEHQIGAAIREQMLFPGNFFSRDATEFCYKVFVYCYAGSCRVVVANIGYNYHPDQKIGGYFKAEEKITDEVALTTNKMRFRHATGVKKFRIATVDRMEQLQQIFGDMLK
jgi:colicin import membrane protein